MRLGGCPQTGALALALVLGPARAAPCFHMEDRDLALMVPAMGTDLVPAMAMDTVEATVAATLGAVEVAGPKDPDPDPDTEPVPPVAGLWSPPASATVRAKTPKWRIG